MCMFYLFLDCLAAASNDPHYWLKMQILLIYQSAVWPGKCQKCVSITVIWWCHNQFTITWKDARTKSPHLRSYKQRIVLSWLASSTTHSRSTSFKKILNAHFVLWMMQSLCYFQPEMQRLLNCLFSKLSTNPFINSDNEFSVVVMFLKQKCQLFAGSGFLNVSHGGAAWGFCTV